MKQDDINERPLIVRLLLYGLVSIVAVQGISLMVNIKNQFYPDASNSWLLFWMVVFIVLIGLIAFVLVEDWLGKWRRRKEKS